MARGRLGLYGEPAYLGVYGSRPFRFGQLRDTAINDLDERLVFAYVPEAANASADNELVRISLPLGDARKLARHLTYIVDVTDGY